MTGSSLGQTRKGMREIDVELRDQAREENSEKDQLGEMKGNTILLSGGRNRRERTYWSEGF